MKKKLLAIMMASLSVVAVVNAADAEAKSATIDMAGSPVVIDGVIDPIWNETAAIGIDIIDIDPSTDGHADPSPENFTGSFKAIWDATNLYVLLIVEDDVLINDDPADITHQDDGFDIVLNPGNNAENGATEAFLVTVNYSTDGTAPVNPDKGGFAVWAGSDITTACTDGANSGFILELAIPWDGISSDAVAAGYELGFDPRYNDDDGNNGDGPTLREGHYKWGTDGGWATPADWSWLILGETVVNAPSAINTNSVVTVKTFPNPVTDVLNIPNYNGKVSVYNAIGAKVMEVSDVQEKINVSELSNGVYVVVTDLGIAQFVK